MVNSAGSLAGAALTVGFLGITLGVAGRAISGTDRQLRQRQSRKPRIRGGGKNARLRRSGIF